MVGTPKAASDHLLRRTLPSARVNRDLGGGIFPMTTCSEGLVHSTESNSQPSRISIPRDRRKGVLYLIITTVSGSHDVALNKPSHAVSTLLRAY